MRPKVESVSNAPAGSLVASFGKGYFSRIKPSRSVCVYHLAGEKTNEVRDMSVSVLTDLAVILFLAEFLNLTGITDENSIVLVDLSLYLGKKCVILYTENFSRLEKMEIVEICKGLRIGCTLCVVPAC